jgi:protein tyrosine phosphatase (PTP) superfamily phosphohydrolase (DUF442 family)
MKGSKKFDSFIQNLIRDDTPKQPKKKKQAAVVESQGLPFVAAPVGGGGDADLL